MAHEGQKDKSGLPYMLHPFIVADHMEGEAETCVALLHDVVEDTSYTLEDLQREGMPEEVLEAVALMTHERGVPYMDYVAALKKNSIARAVKLQDLTHNMDPGRLDNPTPRDLKRREKYQKAYAFLVE